MVTITIVTDFAPRPKRAELTQDQKQDFFNKVKNRNNWKNPIRKTVTLENDDQINDVIDSISHFVGGRTDYEIIKRSPEKINVRFYNLGYYSNIGA
jgi:hypothetical protein